MTWLTLDREPLIDRPVAEFLEMFLPAQAARFGVRLVAVGMVATHVHVLLQMPGGTDIPRLAMYLKGASARVANRDGISLPNRPLRWQRGYDLRSVSPSAIAVVEAYVRSQAQRHPDQAIQER